MSSIAPTPRLGWRLLPAVVTAAVAVIAASLVIATLRDHPVELNLSNPFTQEAAAAPAVWHAHAYAVGTPHLSKKEKVRFQAESQSVRRGVRNLADALALDPTKVSAVAERLLTKDAAHSLVKAAPGIPKNAEAITAMKRTGRIAIQAPHFAAASAEVKIIMSASFEGRAIRWRNDYTFWLQRNDGKWRVIAFDLDRTQLR
jgi:hypothetical protein